jgi:hypothetical protein
MSVEYSDSEHIWIARFDLNDLRDKGVRVAIRAVTAEKSPYHSLTFMEELQS